MEDADFRSHDEGAAPGTPRIADDAAGAQRLIGRIDHIRPAFRVNEDLCIGKTSPLS